MARSKPDDIDVQFFQKAGFQQGTFADETSKSTIFFHHRNVMSPTASVKSVLVLIHGYPQSSYMWRHVITALPSDIPLFVPDVPGTGKSTPPAAGSDKSVVGKAILAALNSLLPHAKEVPLVICGHDRGARICHRLGVDVAASRNKNYPGTPFHIKGAIMLDIVPTWTQFDSFKKSTNGTGSFHWLFLANVDLATSMITAFGGGNWCQTLIDRWAGKNPTGLESLKSDDSIGVYRGYFEQEANVRASCEDYRAGANEDIQKQQQDQEAGIKLNLPSLVMSSSSYLGQRFDVGAVWKEWVSDPSQLKVVDFGDDVGHFLPEEAPEKTTKEIVSFWKSVRGVATG